MIRTIESYNDGTRSGPKINHVVEFIASMANPPNKRSKHIEVESFKKFSTMIHSPQGLTTEHALTYRRADGSLDSDNSLTTLTVS